MCSEYVTNMERMRNRERLRGALLEQQVALQERCEQESAARLKVYQYVTNM